MSDYIASDLDADMKNEWGTDPIVVQAMDREFNFGVDVFASEKNHKFKNYFTKVHSAFDHDWNIYDQTTAWANPPYGRGCIKKAMLKAIDQKALNVTTVFLVPATLDARWLPIKEISEIRIITGGRLSFYHPVTGKKVNGNTKGSMFVIFRPTISPCFLRLVDRDELLAYGSYFDE